MTLILLLGLAALSPRAVTLVWDANSDFDLAGYNVYMALGTAPPQNVATVSTNAFPLPNIPAGVKAQLYVTAFNSLFVESDPSVSVSFTSALGIPPKLTITTNFVQTSGTNWIITLAWNPSPPEYAVSNYQLSIWRDTNLVETLSTTGAQIQLTVPVFTPTFIHLWATNYLGASPAVTLPYGKPAIPRNPKLVFP